MKDLNAVTEMLYGAGQPMAGSDMTDAQALAHIESLRLNTGFCLVRNWIWLDLDVTDEQRTVLEKTQRQPVMIYAHSVIYDSARRWDVGDFVRTSPLHRFDEGFLFKTSNTTYVLLGNGVRKRAALETVGRIC
ncbi:DUF6957 family protein [Stutzerimonas zhaodongensis]|uniref:DUF6957 domain-containing protein n=1 Tax=Stutzerimonas zhaodongensis TaxID=1176257 RepID=A0A365PQJ3_9GAMM|nr:hypothetical protein [Stutzerimonas zhaodongensis]QWV17941.1 hypothetical protein KQ248_04390 [Stutzerimonas zhaodongensis]RBA52677.1 hypothetical protein DQ403_20530 [Stutzerimonas zhaodongensis]